MIQGSAFDRYEEDYGAGRPGPGSSPKHRPSHQSREIKVQRRTKTETTGGERSDRGQRSDMDRGYDDQAARPYRSERDYVERSDQGQRSERDYVEKLDQGQRSERDYVQRSDRGQMSDRGQRSDVDRGYSQNGMRNHTDAYVESRGSHPRSGYAEGTQERTRTAERSGTSDRAGSGMRQGSRGSSVREVSNHLDDMDGTGSGQRTQGGKKFLKKVQHELEEQRQEWKGEVERLTQSSTLPKSMPKNAHMQGTNSYVDTSSGMPIFHAYIDVSEFNPKSISIEYEHLSNRLIVMGKSSHGYGTMTKTFTQKVQLPRYCDSERLSTGISKRGILKVEVPLLFYFPAQDPKSREVKSFVNEVRPTKDGSKVMEILVNTGPGVRASDLRVQVSDDNVLYVTAATSGTNGLSKDKLIKRYTLPENADIDRIKSKMGKDGRLMVLIPLRQH